MDREEYDIVILGAGASGLTAAITAARESKRKTSNESAKMLLIEKNDILAKKILATGNGRCNLSNVSCDDRDIALEFLDSIGVITRTDSAGRIYPYSEDARDVAGALIDACEHEGVCIMKSSEVTGVSFDDGKGTYDITCEIKKGKKDVIISAKAVLIATGGKAAPKFGTTGDGYRFAKKLYHSVTKLAPALTAIETYEDTSMLAGVRAKAKASLIAGGGTLFEETGEVQFTDYGLSGIAVFDMSRYMVIPEGRTLVNGFDDYTVEIDFLPETKEAMPLIEGRIREIMLASGDDPDGIGTGAADAPLLRSIVKAPIAAAILDRTGGEPEMTAWMLKHFTLKPSGLRGWDHAEITRGGIPLTEIDTERMASKFMPGLFFSGEIIDYDGPSGGFNLENAWETGIKAGRAMAGYVESIKE